MMKLIITDYEDHSEVTIKDGCQLLHSYTFDDGHAARAFCTGFNCAKSVINGLVQSLPLSYEIRKSLPAPETYSQQLSKQWVGSI